MIAGVRNRQSAEPATKPSSRGVLLLIAPKEFVNQFVGDPRIECVCGSLNMDRSGMVLASHARVGEAGAVAYNIVPFARMRSVGQ